MGHFKHYFTHPKKNPAGLREMAPIRALLKNRVPFPEPTWQLTTITPDLGSDAVRKTHAEKKTLQH